eukprot:scaffold23202_cov118-Isochrysis_galbana.AAC.1
MPCETAARERRLRQAQQTSLLGAPSMFTSHLYHLSIPMSTSSTPHLHPRSSHLLPDLAESASGEGGSRRPLALHHSMLYARSTN